MGTKCAPPYACLSIEYQEETKRFTPELRKYFSVEECELIKESFKQYLNDGFIFWPKHLDFKHFSRSLNNLHPAIKYTFEKAKLIHSQLYQVLNFFEFEVILYSENTVETDIYYKDTNVHDYLPYNSAHPKYSKDNLPYNLAKGVIAFVSNDEKFEMRLKEWKNWLKGCNYPDSVINQSFYNVKLSGPVPFTDNSKNIPFVTTYYENYR